MERWKKDALLDIIRLLAVKVEQERCTQKDVDAIMCVLEHECDVYATADELAEAYGQSRTNVRNVLSRRNPPPDRKPVRRVMYPAAWFSRQVPSSWRKKHT